MSEVIYTESCHAGLLCMALNLGNSFGSSLSVGVYRIKLNNLTKYVELPVECLRTRVQFPPPPPILKPQRFFVEVFSCLLVLPSAY
jgi:hypothetical protein